MPPLRCFLRCSLRPPAEHKLTDQHQRCPEPLTWDQPGGTHAFDETKSTSSFSLLRKVRRVSVRRRDSRDIYKDRPGSASWGSHVSGFLRSESPHRPSSLPHSWRDRLRSNRE